MSDSILRELEDDIRREELKDLWKEYGPWLIAMAAAIILGTAGGVGWKHYRAAQNQEQTAALFWVVTASEGVTADSAVTKLEPVVGELKGTAQGDLAALRLADRIAESGKGKEALEAYLIAAKNATQPAMRNLAYTLAAHQAITHKLDYGTLPDIKKGEPYYYSWQEAHGWLLLSQDKKDEALKIFAALQSDGATPDALRQRMDAVLAYMNYRAPKAAEGGEKE